MALNVKGFFQPADQASNIDALETTTSRGLVITAFILTIYYFAITFAHLLFLSGTAQIAMATLSTFSCLSYIILGLYLRNRTRPHLTISLVSYIMSLLVSANIFTHVLLLADATQANYLGILLLAAGFLCLSLHWYMVILITNWIGVGGALFILGVQAFDSTTLFIILTSTFVGAIICRARIDALLKMQVLLSEARRAYSDLQASIAVHAETESQLEIVFEATIDSIIIFDQSGHIQRCNKAMLRLFGYRSDEIVGKHLKLLLPSEFSGMRDSTVGQLLGMNRTTLSGMQRQLIGKCKDGTEFPMDVSLSIFDTVAGRMFAMILRDSTDRERTEESLRNAKMEAVEANRAKSRFLRNMSHELKTPLNAIIGYAEILLEEFQEMTEAEVKEDLTRINGAGHTLLKLITDVLDLSRLDSGDVAANVADVSVADFLGELVLRAEAMASRSGNSFEYKNTCSRKTFPCDAELLRQCLLHLLDNAFKYTNDGSITLGVSEETENSITSVVFAVEDTGPGIPKEKLQSLWEAFEQADGSTTRAHEGIGLGLTMVHRISQVLGISVRVRSREGSGSIFSVRIPASTPSSHRKPEERSIAHSQKGPSRIRRGPVEKETLLLVDDDVLMRDIVTRVVKKDDWNVVFAVNGREALEVLGDCQPVAILLDLMMPEMNGFEFLDVLDRDPKFRGVPVIIITSKQLTDDENASLQGRVYAIVNKSPLRGDRIRAILTEISASLQ